MWWVIFSSSPESLKRRYRSVKSTKADNSESPRRKWSRPKSSKEKLSGWFVMFSNEENARRAKCSYTRYNYWMKVDFGTKNNNGQPFAFVDKQLTERLTEELCVEGKEVHVIMDMLATENMIHILVLVSIFWQLIFWKWRERVQKSQVDKTKRGLESNYWQKFSKFTCGFFRRKKRKVTPSKWSSHWERFLVRNRFLARSSKRACGKCWPSCWRIWPKKRKIAASLTRSKCM